MLAQITTLHRAFAGPSVAIFPSNGSFPDLLFHKTFLSFQIMGQPVPPFSINLIQFFIVLFLAFSVNGATERMTGRKVSLMMAIIVTLFGSWLFVSFVRLPYDFSVEGVPIVATLLGALIVAVFYTLTLGKASDALKK